MKLKNLLKHIKIGEVPLKIIQSIEHGFSPTNDLLEFEDFYIIRRTSNKYKNSYRYHITTSLLQAASPNTIVYRSDYYLIFYSSFIATVKNFSFIIKLQFVNNAAESLKLESQLMNTISMSKILYGRITYIDQQKQNRLHAYSKNLFRGKWENEYTVIGTIIPFIEGKDLYRASLAGEINDLSLLQKIVLVLQFLKKLKIFHDRGQLHGDIKLLNVVYNKTTHQVNLIDLDSVNSPKGMIVRIASPGFTAPESYIKGEVRPINLSLSSDLYSAAGVIGCIFFGLEFAHCRSDKLEMCSTLDPYKWMSQFIPYNFNVAKNFLNQVDEKTKIPLAIIYGYLLQVMCTINPDPGRKSINATIKFFEYLAQSVVYDSPCITVADLLSVEFKPDMFPVNEECRSEEL